ncbi:MAG: serine/threonine protein kinase [Lentisphaeraceae bacterium]|nr:serine/threonine protein kinase [Lentisphaeraceae bacterium]
MAYAHSEGMVHLDLKPANIQVSGFGDVIVCDWGLATFIDSENELGHQHSDHYEYFNKRYFTLSGQIKGTPGYMAPEQAQGGKQKKDERTDIFALGCILYELLTMRQAIEGENLQNILDNTTQGLITAPSKRRLDLFIPSSLEAICMKALQTSRHKRYQSVEYIITEIEAYRQGFATEAEDVSFFKQVRLLYKRNHRICLLAAVLLTTIFTISFYFVNSVREKERATATALQKLKSEKELNSKIAEDASMIYAKRGRKAYFLFDSKEAIEQLEMALRLHPLNNVALEQMSKIYTVRQQFAEARKYLKPLGAGRNEDLLDFYLQVENQGLQKPLTLRQIYPLVQKHLDKSRLTLKSHIFKFAIFSTDDLKTIGKDISWLLSQENKPVNIHCNVSKRPGGFSVDLSGNKGLEKISSIGMFPILHLNLRGSKVGKVTFSNSYPLLKEVWLSKGQLSERDRRYFGNAKIIEK